MSPLILQSCESCHAGYFPPRLICSRCGSARFTVEPVATGVVEQVTIVHKAVGRAAEQAALVTVRLPGGQHVIAGLDGLAEAGDVVTLHQDAGAVWARPGSAVPASSEG